MNGIAGVMRKRARGTRVVAASLLVLRIGHGATAVSGQEYAKDDCSHAVVLT